jgi:spore maturation protein A
MITFLAVNTSSITLIPTTVIAVRMTYGSKSPTDIVGPTLLATIISAIGAILIDRYFYHRRMRKEKK